MEDYQKVEVVRYVKEGLESGRMVPRQAEKFARIMARPGVVGEEVITFSVDSMGNEIKEKVAYVTLNENTNRPGWVVTKIDEEGEIVVDENGYPNEWIIDDTTFRKKYEVDPINPTLYKPRGGIQTFVEILDNIILEQWGSEMKIARGGFINITNADDMYGISSRDFYDTYQWIDEIKKGGKSR